MNAKNSSSILTGRRILFFVLLSIQISSAQEKFCADRDSLFTVFSKYQELQLEAASLRADTSIYKSLYRERTDYILNLETEIENFKGFIVPNYEAIEKRQAEEIDFLKSDVKKEKVKKWVAVGGSVVSILLFSIL